MDESKSCTQCGEVKDLETGFHRDGRRPDGRFARCRDCVNSARAERYWQNRDRELERNRLWRLNNRDLNAAIQKKWHESNREHSSAKRAAWRRSNPERDAASRQAWLDANPDYYTTWTAANRESVRRASRKYTQAHPEANAEASRRRRAREREVAVGEVDLDALWTGACSICGREMDAALRRPDLLSKSVDHVIPLARGGTHEQSNLAWAHLICNIRKGARMPDDRTAVG